MGMLNVIDTVAKEVHMIYITLNYIETGGYPQREFIEIIDDNHFKTTLENKIILRKY